MPTRSRRVKSTAEYITGELGCRWVRYNPYAADFDIFDIIRRILDSAIITRTPLRRNA
jgi:hypothetical protein